jgi:hypothetical protein
MLFHAVSCHSMQFHAVSWSSMQHENVRVMFFMFFHFFHAVPCSSMQHENVATETKHAARMMAPSLKAGHISPIYFLISTSILDRF